MPSSPAAGNVGKDCILTFENYVIGETQDADANIKDGVELISFSWGASSARGAGGGALRAPMMDDMRFVAAASKASPQILQACLENKRIRSAKLHVRKQGVIDSSGKSQGAYYTVEIKDVAVTSYKSGIELVADSSVPVDEFLLNFTEIEFIYTPQTDKGGLGGAVIANGNLKNREAFGSNY